MSTVDDVGADKPAAALKKPSSDSKKRSGELKSDLVPIAAIGASAGGLEPIESFFGSMPPDSGCAFVIIQHLSPDFRSLMDELLARHSTMSIHRVMDGMEIEPNSIYLNPARSVMTVHENTLRVEKVVVQDTVYLPIDLFFESLASSRGEDAMGLVFSGTGSDGTRGAELISLCNGKVLVQDPSTTRFDGMPKSVIAQGHYVEIASPVELAGMIQRLLKNEPIEPQSNIRNEAVQEPLHDLLSMLRYRYGTDFRQYKEATVLRRIERRAQIKHITDIKDYQDLLNTDDFEMQELYADLLIEVTEFFRDVPAFNIIRNQVLPDLMQGLRSGETVRIWVPGCASGEEAYSLAILLQEQARVMDIQPQFKILATDIHIRSMNKATTGIYDEEALGGVPDDLVSRYFDFADGYVQIKPSIRNMVFFSTHDVMRDPPFTRIDLVSCRNLLIYLKDEAQEKVMSLLHFALRKNGYLFLGPSEHIGRIAHEFDAVNDKWRIFKKRRDVKILPAESIFQKTDLSKGIPSSSARNLSSTTDKASMNDQSISFKRAQRVALEEIVEEYAPAGFLLTHEGVIVYIFGSAGSLLPMKSGSFSKNIIELIRPELKVIVTAALDQAKNHDFAEFRRSAYIKEEMDSSTSFEIRLRPMNLAGETQRFVLLSISEQKQTSDELSQVQPRVENFISEDSSEALRQRVLVLEHNLQSSEESLQSTIEELETSNEELQSINEELMSTNEELQSTNEELHSVNEELYTVSAEHQRKNQELTERDNDLDTLLNLSKIGTLHLDNNLKLIRFTNGARSVFNIMPQDLGRPFDHITLRTDEHDVLSLVKEVIEKQVTNEVQLNINKSVYLLRILPHQKDGDTNNGVLITVIDITDLQLVRNELENLNIEYKDIVDSTDSFIVRWDAKTNKILYCNGHYATRWGLTTEKAIGQDIVKIRPIREQQPFLDSFKDLAIDESVSRVFTTTDASGYRRSAKVTIRSFGLNGEEIEQYQVTGIDCTEEQNYQDAVDRISVVFSETHLKPDQKLEAILSIGLDYYQLETAVISGIDGDIQSVRNLASKVPISYKIGAELTPQNSLCHLILEKGTSLALNRVAEASANKLEGSDSPRIESFVGAPVQTINGLFGSVSFSSSKKRVRSFTAGEEGFSLLIAGWIGYLLSNIEQMEFMLNQNDYYQSLFKSVPAMLFLCDADGVVLSSSDRFAKQLNLSRDSVAGKRCVEFFESADFEVITQALTAGEAADLPVKLSQGANTALDVELSISIKPIGTIQDIRMVIVNDVSSRNQASREAAEKHRRLEVANESLNQFAFIASHDLQEPLRKIQQFSSFLEEDLGNLLDEDGRYHINVIVDASQRMSTLIHDLLSFSSTAKTEVKFETVELEPLLTEIVEEMKLPKHLCTVNIDCQSMPTVEANKLLLNQMLTNLVGNGFKYRVSGRATIISISSTKKRGVGKIEVSDNGIGFDMQFAKKIFEPFNRLHNNKEYKGNGIGLAICQSVCDKHEWTISAEGVPEEGSKFTISMNCD